MMIGTGMISPIMEGLVVLLVGWGVKISSDNRRELRKLNGRTIALEQWKKHKITLDDERHQNIERRIDNL